MSAYGTFLFCSNSVVVFHQWRVIVVNTVTLFFVNDQRDAQILFYVFISIYNPLHVSRTQRSSSGETNCINKASGNSHSMLVAEMCAGWKKTVFFQPAHISATNME